MNDATAANIRDLESGITADFSEQLSYGAYLDLARLLSAQHPRSEPELHDEMLFIIQHQVAELWMKLLLHELQAARTAVARDELGLALKGLARVKHVLKQLVEQWDVLATLTPSEYAQIRPFLATSSGFQSWQYRSIEFILGNKNVDMLRVFDHDPDVKAGLAQLLEEPTLYDEFLRHLARAGYDVPTSVLERDVTAPYREVPELVDVFRGVYAEPTAQWGVYEACEELVDIEDLFQQWRFRHLQVVLRTIGHQQGTGGSSGVAFLKRALDLTFFPELYAVRSTIA